MRKVTWVVVADGSRASVYYVDGPAASLKALDVLVHPESRLRNQQISADGQGSSFASSGPGQRVMQPHTMPKQREKDLFAHEVVDYLEQGRSRGEYDQLMVLAAPAFLGRLRGAMNTQLSRKVVYELSADFSRASAETILEQLPREPLTTLV